MQNDIRTSKMQRRKMFFFKKLPEWGFITTVIEVVLFVVDLTMVGRGGEMMTKTEGMRKGWTEGVLKDRRKKRRRRRKKKRRRKRRRGKKKRGKKK